MMPLDFVALAQQCAPQVSPVTMAAIIQTESGFNPFAIGVVHGRLLHQPSSVDEAVATVRALVADGWNFSVGLAQVNRVNWPAYGLNEQNAFDPCSNLAAGAAILHRCFESARRAKTGAEVDSQSALRASLSCYAGGNFSKYRAGYVQRVIESARLLAPLASPLVVPQITPFPVVPVDSGLVSRPVRLQPIRQPRSEPAETSPDRLDGDANGSAMVF